MNKGFREWFVAERARALALVFLTRRDDLIVTETRNENGLDYTVSIADGKVANRPFGVCLAASMNPVTLDGANKQLKPVLEKVRAIGPSHIPVCLFLFTVKDGQGYYAWAYEPVVTNEGQPRLRETATAQCRKLSNETLAEIVSLVGRWYDSFYTTIADSGNSEHHGEEDVIEAPSRGKKRQEAGQA